MKKTKLLLIIVSIVVFLLTCTLSVNATEVIKSGSAGSATWKLYADGRMEVIGKGEVKEPTIKENGKTKRLSTTIKSKVKRLIIDDRITSIGHDWDSEDPFGTYVFANYINLENVELPSNLTYITHSAFENCKSLKSVDIPGSVKTVGSSAFFDCEKLEELILNEGTVMLDDNAFNGCSALKSIHIPKTLTKMYGRGIFDVFAYCENLETITVADDNTEYTSMDLDGNECNAIMDKELKTLYLGCKTTNVVPQGITSIYQNAFKGSSIESIELPNSIKNIGFNAFQRCVALESISIPNGVIEIESFTFSESGLKSIEIPDTVKKIDDEAFLSCKNLENIVMHNGLEIIGEWAFAGCKISNLDIPNGVKTIGCGAFNNCQSLNIVRLSDSLTVIEEKVFRNAGIQSIEIPNNVSIIKESAFEGCDLLMNIAISNMINKIQKNAFKNCEFLSNAVMPNKAVYIDKTAISGCKALSATSKKSIYNANKKYIQKASAKGIKLKTSKRKVAVTWTGVSDKSVKPASYVVYRGTKAKKLKKIATVKTKKYIDKKKLRKGKKYYYKVVAKVKNLDGKYCYTKPTVVKNIRCK